MSFFWTHREFGASKKSKEPILRAEGTLCVPTDLDRMRVVHNGISDKLSKRVGVMPIRAVEVLKKVIVLSVNQVADFIASQLIIRALVIAVQRKLAVYLENLSLSALAIKVQPNLRFDIEKVQGGVKRVGKRVISIKLENVHSFLGLLDEPFISAKEDSHRDKQETFYLRAD